MTEPVTAWLAPEPAALVDRYLDDLARMLSDVPPGERADALGSVREYVDDAVAQLGRPATSGDVADVLRRLGRPEDLTHDLLERGIVGTDPSDATTPSCPASGGPTPPTAPLPPVPPPPGRGTSQPGPYPQEGPSVGTWASAPAVAHRGDGAATAGLALGVAALVLPLLGLPLGIGALVLARRARRLGTSHDGRRAAALALGGVGIAIGVVMVLGLAATFAWRTAVGDATVGSPGVVAVSTPAASTP